jgi:hypothetical protein
VVRRMKAARPLRWVWPETTVGVALLLGGDNVSPQREATIFDQLRDQIVRARFARRPFQLSEREQIDQLLPARLRTRKKPHDRYTPYQGYPPQETILHQKRRIPTYMFLGR